ncbi:MAG TPA: hypothetical protein VFX64_03615 [Candidatus Nitrosotalea sp.]|nr:hypothetical protein [Candidatus Nitrosotalea sp.]
MKKSTAAVMSIALLAISSVAVYGIFYINSETSVRPTQQVQVSNYSAEIDNLKPQISSLSNNITSLGTVKGDISDIKGKLSDLETKITQAQQEATASQKPVMILDGSSYFQGDVIHITAAGLDPQTTVTMQIVDSSGFVVMHRDTTSDSSGKISFDFPLSFTTSSGNHTVRIISGQKTVSQPITILSTTITYSSVNQFTAQTSKGVYQAGDIFEFYGVGVPNTTVSSTLTSPTGRVLMFNTTVQSDGTYDVFYTDSQPFETGTWYIALKNQGLERTVYFSVSPNPSLSPYLFTAHAFSNIYQVGNLIGVTGVAPPFTDVNAVLTSPSGLTYSATTTASSSGSYIVSFATTYGYEVGNWHVTLTNQGQTRQVSIFLESVILSSGSDTFTAQTDKTIYVKGDQVKISGTAQSFSSISSVLASPSGYTYNGAAKANVDGSYNITYLTSPSFESGNWHVTLHNGALSQVISIYLGS